MLEAFTGVKLPGSKTSEQIADIYAKAIDEATPQDPGLSDALVQGAGSMASFIVSNLGTTGAVTAMRAPAWLARVLGLSVPVVAEALQEASQTFRTLLGQGMPREQAANQAAKTFAANTVLIAVTNKMGIFSESGGVLARAAKGALFEGGQEASQDLIQDATTGQPVDLWSVFQSGFVGAVLGGGVGVVGGVVQRRGGIPRGTEIKEAVPRFRNYDDAQKAVDTFERTLSKKYGQDAVALAPVYAEAETPIAPEEIAHLRHLYAARDRFLAPEERGTPPVQAPTEAPTVPPAAPPEPPVAPPGGRLAEAERAFQEGRQRAAEAAAKISEAAAAKAHENVPPIRVPGRPEVPQGVVVQAVEPPVPAGFVRLYRGEGTEDVALPEWAKTNAGQWFTTSRLKAEGFQRNRAGQLRSVDIPESALAQYRVYPEGGDEYLIPQIVQQNRGARILVPAPVAPLPTSAEPAVTVDALDALGPSEPQVETQLAPVEPTPPTHRPPEGAGAFSLPRDLAGARPRWKDREVTFESNLDKAYYIAAQPTPSKRDADYVAAIQAYTGESEAQIRATGRLVRGAVTDEANKGLAGPVWVPDQGKAAIAPSPRAPSALPAPPPRQVRGREPVPAPPPPEVAPPVEATPPAETGPRQGVFAAPTVEESQRLLERVRAFTDLEPPYAGQTEEEAVAEGRRLESLIEQHLEEGAPEARIDLEEARAEVRGILNALSPEGPVTTPRGRRLETPTQFPAERPPALTTPGAAAMGIVKPGRQVRGRSTAPPAQVPAPPPAPSGTLPPAGGPREQPVPVEQPGPADQGALAGAPPADVQGAGEVGAPGGNPVPGAGAHERPPGEPHQRPRPELGPGVGTGEAGGVPAEREGEPGPSREPRPAEVPARVEPATEHATGRDFVIDPERDTLGQGSPREKAHRNLDVLRLLKRLETEGRLAGADEQKILVGYTGWGGLKQVFADYSPEKWHREVQQALRDLLTPAEYSAAQATVLNAHYTSAPVIQGMWDAVKRLGADRGRILEPSMGAGHFFGLQPTAAAARSQRVGVEIDLLTGRIAAQLYQGADVHVAGFESVVLPDNFFDLAISNVPFGNYAVHDPAYRKTPFVLRSIHNYFFAKALDKVRPGGVVAFITSSWTMDARTGDTIRKYLGERAELLGAIRLPSSTFKGTAGTEVTTDILFLQRKGEGVTATGTKWADVAYTEAPGGERLTINEYYRDHPRMMLGTMTLGGTMYGGAEQTLEGPAPTRDMIREAIGNLPENVVPPRRPPKSVERPSTPYQETAEKRVKPNAYTIEGGKLLQRVGTTLVAPDLPMGLQARTRGMVKIRDAVHEVFRTQLTDQPEEAITAARTTLNTVYDGFVRQHGPLNLRQNIKAFDGDPDQPLLLALENWNAETRTATKGTIFTTRTLARYQPAASADSADAALLISLNERGHLDWERMTQLTGRPAEALQQELRGRVYQNPEGEWETTDEYLSGDVRQKLAIAEQAAKQDPTFQDNARALKEVQPKDLEPGEIDARLGSPWVPTTDIAAFLAERLGGRPDAWSVSHVEEIAAWKVKGPDRYLQSVANTKTWGTSRYYGHELIEDALNHRTPTVWDKIDDTRVVNQEETAAAREQQQKLKDDFTTWAWTAPERADRLATLYNRSYNSARLREFDGSHLTLPGANPLLADKLRPHQKAAIYQGLQGKNTLLAHEVGTGKTWIMVAIAMEAKRLGLAQKPMFLVPNSRVLGTAKEFLQLYPAANILAPTEKDFEAKNRKKLMARIATGNWDAVIVGHSSFGLIPVSDEIFNSFLQKEIDQLETYLTEGAAGGMDTRMLRELEKAKKRLEVKLRDKNAAKRDVGTSFEELGADLLFVDESQAFKNLYFTTRMTRVAGLPNSESKRAFDLYVKTRYLTRRNNGGGVIFATGTPITKTIAEVFTVQRYLAGDRLEQLGLSHFDAWAGQFGDTLTGLEIAPDGSGYRVHTRFARFTNMAELQTMFRDFADVKFAEELKIPRPPIKGGKPQIIASPTTPELKAFVDTLVHRAEHLKTGHVDPRVDNMPMITTDGRKAALDMRLIAPTYRDHPDSKVNKAAHEIFTHWKESRKDKGTQLVFVDFSTPHEGKGEKAFNVYDDLKAKLIRLGIPAHEVRFIHEAKKREEAQELFDGVNAGRIRVLLASTAKAGTGVNVQERLVWLHHLDPPWNPADIEQREGRILRQGNKLYEADPEHFEIGITRYVTQGSFDAYMWQTLETKARIIAQVMKGNVSVRSVEDVEGGALTYAEVKAIASGNPAVMEKVKVDAELRKLDQLRSHHRTEASRMHRELAGIPDRIRALQKEAEGYKADLATREKHKTEKFSIVVGGKHFDDREAAGKALRARLDAQDASTEVVIGTLGGFDIVGVMPADRRYATPHLSLRGASLASATFVGLHADAGVMQSLEASIRGLDSREAAARGAITQLEQKKADLTAEVAKPFEHEDKIKGLVARKAQLDKSLDLDKADAQAAAAEQSGEEAPEPPAVEEEDELPAEPGPPAPDAADEVTEQNLRRVRGERKKEGETGALRIGRFVRGRGGQPPGPLPPSALGTPTPPGGPPRGPGDMEAALTSTARGMIPSLRERLGKAWAMVRGALIYEDSLRDFPLEQDEFRLFQTARHDAFAKAGEDVTGVVGAMKDLNEYKVFTDLVLLRDYQARLSDPERFPFGVPHALTLEEVERKIRDLEATAPREVIEALDANVALMDAEATDLEDRELMDPQRRISGYFPHFVLEKQRGPANVGTGQRLQAPRRGFLRRAVGSEMEIETDYITAMFRHRSEVRFANAVDDFAEKLLDRHDRRGSLPEEARKALVPGQRFTIDGQEYKATQYKPGRGIFGAQTVPERLIEQALANAETVIEIPVEELRSVGALGRYRRIYVVPTPIADRFEKFAPAREGDMMKLLNRATSAWKAVTIGFWGTAGNIMNISGDLMNLARTPGALLMLPKAAKEVLRFRVTGEASDLVRLMQEHDALDSGYVASEVYFRVRAPEIRQFLTRAERLRQTAKDAVVGAMLGGLHGYALSGGRPLAGVAGAALGAYAGGPFFLRTIPEVREAIPRMAMGIYQLRRLERGRPLRPGGTVLPGELAGTVRGAMKIAREFTVDYMKFTPEENRLVRGFLLPFYSWMRQNTPNWLRFLLGAGGFTALGMIGTRLLLEYWNNADPERRIVERSLPAYRRGDAHLVTGWHDQDGKMIVLYLAGDPMADALGMVGQKGTINRVSDLLTKRVSLSKAAHDALSAVVWEPLDRVVNLINPGLKIGIELKTNRSALTGQEIVPRELEGTTAARERRIRYALESAVRPIREARMLNERPGEEIDPLTHRYGLGLPFERADVGKAKERAALTIWYDARAEFVEKSLNVLHSLPVYGNATGAQRSILEVEVARQAQAEFQREVQRPVSGKQQMLERYQEAGPKPPRQLPGRPSSEAPSSVAAAGLAPSRAVRGRFNPEPVLAEAAKETGLDADFLRRVMGAESGGSEHAFNPTRGAGAYGPMQIIERTGKALGINRGDPRENILGGARHLAGLIEKYGGDREQALAAYNAGEKWVDQGIQRAARTGGVWWQFLPKPKETVPYVRQILGPDALRPATEVAR